jgi:signal transduction histidine kinase
MTLVDKYSIRTPLIVGILLMIFINIIYFLVVDYIDNEYFTDLERKVNMRQELFFEVLEKNKDLQAKMDKQSTLQYNKETYCIMDLEGKSFYSHGDNHPVLGSELLQEVTKKKRIQIIKDDLYRLTYVHTDNEGDRTMILDISGHNYDGIKTKRFLCNLLIISILIILIVIAISTRILTKNDINPIGRIANRIQTLTENNLSERLPEETLKNEIGQMATSFNALLERLDRSYSQQKNFVSYVTHELRTPLTIMLGNADVALMKDRSKEEYQNTLETIKSEIKGLIKLVNDLLEIAHANANPQSIVLSLVRIDEILFSGRTQLLQKAHNYTINIDFVEIPDSDDSLVINGNALFLRLAFMNLMENGCKYNDERTVDVRIETLPHGIEITFEDNGYGIDEKDLKNIFEPFYRSTKVQDISGHGIGLPLTKRIIQIHNGEYTIESQIGKGTKFKVFFPNLAKKT